MGIGDRGRSCKEYSICGRVIAPDVLVVRLVKEEIQVGDNFEVAISVYWVTDSVERCRVGFLPRFMIPYADSSMDYWHRWPMFLIRAWHHHQLGRRYTTIMGSVMQQFLIQELLSELYLDE